MASFGPRTASHTGKRVIVASVAPKLHSAADLLTMRPQRRRSELVRCPFVPGLSRPMSLIANLHCLTAVRVRPPLDSSDPGFDVVPHRFRGSTCQVPNPTSLTIESAQGKKLFVFDRVFGDREDQDDVWEYVSESVSSFVQGYNVSILAYGQSGAGKSYTMGTSSPGEQQKSSNIGKSGSRSNRDSHVTQIPGNPAK